MVPQMDQRSENEAGGIRSVGPCKPDEYIAAAASRERFAQRCAQIKRAAAYLFNLRQLSSATSSSRGFTNASMLSHWSWNSGRCMLHVAEVFLRWEFRNSKSS